MRRIEPAYIKSKAVGLRCRCGLVFRASEFTNGLCPECRLAEKVFDDWASRAPANHSATIGDKRC